MALNPTTVTEKWVRRAQGAGQDFIDGVKNTTVNPMEEAAKNTAKALNNYTESVTSGRMERALRKVTKDSWIKSTVEKGASRFTTGVAAGKEKMQAFMQDFLPYAETVSNDIKNMPDITFEDAKARMLAAVDKLHAYKMK
jgi:hypothetical protein